jgi:hypothetical protein
MRILVTVILLAHAASAVASTPLSFNGVDGRSNISAVKARFSTAKPERVSSCKPGEKSRRFANGVTRCDYLTLPSYRLGGYDFTLSFYFADNGGLQSLSLHWPALATDKELPSAREIENAYWSIVDLYVTKYGRYVATTPCSYLGGRCQEWQMDHSTDWHAGGERIKVEYDTQSKIFGGVSIEYSFANPALFDRF